ncbi:MAG: PilZ domain-containing protein [Treponema sp.]|jgi:hypothetical protein|nr:PilZ domain-containing protein [Treponema sp.]
MLFKKKQKSADQENSSENRREPRYSTWAQVRINGFEGQALLRNINRGGFRMESRTYAAITVGEHYIMRITPEMSAVVHPFDIEVEVRWVQSTEKSFNSGFLILKPPADRSLEKYITYVKTQNKLDT